MSLIYDLNELSHSGLDAMQTSQRDWSPYLVHFTSGKDMEAVRSVLKRKSIDPQLINEQLHKADKMSFDVFAKIVSSKIIECRTSIKCIPSSRLCVSLSECSLPGILSHSERYGRFGFMFEKRDIYSLKGRPCQYLDKDICTEIGRISTSNCGCKISRMNGFANTYIPTAKIKCTVGKPRDFTVEREWRVMDNVNLKILKGVLCPYDYWERVFNCVKEGLGMVVPVYPLDVLYRWGV